MTLVLALVAGAVFGAGLLLAGMSQPAKVIGFLDVTRGWDPSLAFVMVGAIPVYGLAFRLWDRRERRAVAPPAPLGLGSNARIDRPLLLGAALFGVGWGLGGLCPGPGLVVLGAGTETGLVFVAAMVAGMVLQHRTRRA